MLIQHWQIGHAQFIWNLRQNPKCAEVFANIWSCNQNDLLVSFDAASFHMPPETTKIGWHKTTWYHSDQSYTDKGFKCAQSWVTAFDVNRGDATLAFYEGSNNFHTDYNWNQSKVIGTVEALTATFTDLYPINKSQPSPGIAIGRYPEDVYDGDAFQGGNPWVLTTLAVAETYYELAGWTLKHTDDKKLADH